MRVLIVLLLLIAFPTRAGLREGVKAYKRGDYATALIGRTAKSLLVVSLIAIGLLHGQSHATEYDDLPNWARTWVDKTCPRDWGPALWRGCMENNIAALTRPGFPNARALSASDQQWLTKTCPQDWGPALWRGCMESNLAALRPTERTTATPAPRTSPPTSSPVPPPGKTKTRLERFRSEHPEYGDLSDQDLAERLYRKFYSDMPKEEFDRAIGLSKPEPGPSSLPERPSEAIREAQERLRGLGYDVGPADGRLGPRTRAAIISFQEDHNLSATGEIDQKTATAILRESQRRKSAKPHWWEKGRIAEEREDPGRRNWWEKDPVAEEFLEANAPQRALKQTGSGTGFAVTGDGYLVTNVHVVEGCVEVRSAGKGAVKVVAREQGADLALLKVEGWGDGTATFRQGRGIGLGDEVLVAGFPLQGLLASDLNVTTGTVSAMAGPRGDRRLVQITAPVQPGNSGGPLLDFAGNVAGVVVGKLDALAVAAATGDIPQNVNFAINANTVRTFLDAWNVAYETAPSDSRLGAREVATKARAFTVNVECWK